MCGQDTFISLLFEERAIRWDDTYKFKTIKINYNYRVFRWGCTTIRSECGLKIEFLILTKLHNLNTWIKWIHSKIYSHGTLKFFNLNVKILEIWYYFVDFDTDALYIPGPFQWCNG